MRYAFINDHKTHYAVNLLCDVMQVSRRGFYSWLTRPASKRTLENKALTALIREIFEANRRVYGAPRIYQVLRDRGCYCSLNRVACLMRKTLPPR